MTTVFRYTLARFRGQALGWGAILFLLGMPSCRFTTACSGRTRTSCGTC